MSKIIQFSREAYTYSTKGREILDQAIKLTKMGIQKHFSQNPTSNNISTYSINEDEYNETNEIVKKAMIKYAAESANIDTNLYDLENNPNAYKTVVNQFSTFREALFAIQTQIIDTVNSTTEVAQALLLAEVRNIADGDSQTFDIDTKSLFKVEDVGYSNNASRLQYQFQDPIFLTPRPKEASVAVDLYQFNAIGYDFGKQMAKIAISFRNAMFDSVIAAVFDSTPLTSTPFYKATFAKLTFQELANRVTGANGSDAMAYGSSIALGKASDTVGDKWAYGTSAEFVKNGFIRDLYGVPSMVLKQAVNSNDANYNFKVPDDRMLITSPATDKIVKVVMEGQTFVQDDDGRSNSINLKNYKYKQSWAVKIATQSAYGIQMV